MKFNNNKCYTRNYLPGAMIIGIIMGFALGFALLYAPEPQEVQEPQMFDTSVIEENWCGDSTDGTVRLVSAWVVSEDNGLYTLEDETGNLWEIADVAIAEDDFLLLWIADRGTANVEDDLILKCWAEVH